jgi:hypothetical protein|tara:strand:+ start:1704 stop:2066 length:363 start_codon:yes stop_codon:yes gene_type:complete
MISSLIYIKVFGYVKLMSRVLTILGVRPNVRCKAQHSDAIHNEIKKHEIRRIALQCMYEAPSLNEYEELTVRQVRLKMILHEALDIAHTICEHRDAQECLWAWEMVDEIDDAATRAGVKY